MIAESISIEATDNCEAGFGRSPPLLFGGLRLGGADGTDDDAPPELQISVAKGSLLAPSEGFEDNRLMGKRMRAGCSWLGWALLTAVSALLILITGQPANAQDGGLRAAVDQYHRALEARDLSKMGSLWEHDDRVVLVNPISTAVSVGWPAVERNWRLLFDAFTDLKLTQLDGPHVQIRGDIALCTGIVSADIKLKSGASVTEATFETAVFEKSGDGWLLISHVASTVPRFAQ